MDENDLCLWCFAIALAVVCAWLSLDVGRVERRLDCLPGDVVEWSVWTSRAVCEQDGERWVTGG
jgi:hypothetical protein